MKAKKLAEILMKNPEAEVYFHNSEYGSTKPFTRFLMKISEAKSATWFEDEKFLRKEIIPKIDYYEIKGWDERGLIKNSPHYGKPVIEDEDEGKTSSEYLDDEEKVYCIIKKAKDIYIIGA